MMSLSDATTRHEEIETMRLYLTSWVSGQTGRIEMDSIPARYLEEAYDRALELATEDNNAIVIGGPDGSMRAEFNDRLGEWVVVSEVAR